MSYLDKRSRQLEALEALAALVKSAEGAAHVRLKGELSTWVAKQFGKEFELKELAHLSGIRPDVLLWNSRDGYLFIGDAKNADNESPGKQETIQRIASYVDKFAELCRANKIKGGVIAIATNDADEAANWLSALNRLATSAGLSLSDGSPPNFQIEHLNAQTWIVWW